MTWRHPRGLDPLLACSEAWKQRTGVEVLWDERSLQDFESYPVEDLARRYDLIVIDHPHVGQITAEGCLRPFDEPDRADERSALRRGSVGPSYESYEWLGKQWALPIDAATQVQAWRPDRPDGLARDWADVTRLAREGRVAWPLRAPHSLLSLFSLAGALGARSDKYTEGQFVEPQAGAEAFGKLVDLAPLLDISCYEADPIAVFEMMSLGASSIDCCPCAYGYVSYSREGFRQARLAFTNLPSIGLDGSVGSGLGGTGMAISSFCADAPAAASFAYWVASGIVQSTVYVEGGGQPAHDEAWIDDAANRPALDFYKATRRTLDGSRLRPRHDGYMPFQHAASERLNAGLRGRESGARVIAEINDMFNASFRR